MDDFKSKSQKKREAVTWQDLGVSLVGLSIEKLKELPLSEKLYRAVVDAKSLKSFGAVRRQALWIGKLLRIEGGEDVAIAYQNLCKEESGQTAIFHVIEAWRTRLLSEEKQALTEFMNLYATVDLQAIRHLIKQAKAEQQHGAPLGASRALFRYLRSIIQ